MSFGNAILKLIDESTDEAKRVLEELIMATSGNVMNANEDFLKEAEIPYEVEECQSIYFTAKIYKIRHTIPVETLTSLEGLISSNRSYFEYDQLILNKLGFPHVDGRVEIGLIHQLYSLLEEWNSWGRPRQMNYKCTNLDFLKKYQIKYEVVEILNDGQKEYYTVRVYL